MTGPYTYRNPRCNPPLTDKNELIGGPLGAFTKGNDTHTPIPAVLHALTPAPVSAPLSINKLFKKFRKTYLKAQTHPTHPKPQESLSKPVS